MLKLTSFLLGPKIPWGSIGLLAINSAVTSCNKWGEWSVAFFGSKPAGRFFGFKPSPTDIVNSGSLYPMWQKSRGCVSHAHNRMNVGCTWMLQKGQKWYPKKPMHVRTKNNSIRKFQCPINGHTLSKNAETFGQMQHLSWHVVSFV